MSLLFCLRAPRKTEGLVSLHTRILHGCESRLTGIPSVKSARCTNGLVTGVRNVFPAQLHHVPGTVNHPKPTLTTKIVTKTGQQLLYSCDNTTRSYCSGADVITGGADAQSSWNVFVPPPRRTLSTGQKGLHQGKGPRPNDPLLPEIRKFTRGRGHARRPPRGL
jgi:hypothetical protein